MELFLASMVLAGLILIPVSVYRLVARRHETSWNWTERVPLATGAAYRGSWLRLEHTAGVPQVVKVASFISLALIVPAILSLPALAIGLCEEWDHNVGPATLLGPTGLALSVGIVTASKKQTRREKSARNFAIGVGLWSILHNVVVLMAVLYASTHDLPSNDSWKEFAVDGFGAPAIVYALFSFAHAVLLISAASAHEQASDRVVDDAEPESYGAPA